MSENIIHMVLAKLLTHLTAIREYLFLVPKYYDEKVIELRMILK